jgi:CubicO group peptidase (beta-lactamase class C family)
MTKAIRDKMSEAVEKSVFPGAVLLAGLGGKLILHEAFGYASIVPRRVPMTRRTRFDLASLTKPLATATAIMLLVNEGRIDLSDSVERWIPEFGNGGKSKATVFHLLNHSSGLRALRPYHREFIRSRKKAGSRAARRRIFERLVREKTIYPPGTRSLYSDLGFMLAGKIVETAGGMRLDRFCRRRLFSPLGLSTLGYRRVTGQNPKSGRYAATERCAWRRRVLCGEVDDSNAYVMGGIEGHAGLFGTGLDVYRFAQAILDAANGSGGMVPQALADRFVTRAGTPGSSWALGWDTPSAPSTSGRYFSPRSFGHLGFTGCSIWCDRDRELIVVLLTNRIHPSARNNRIRAFRPVIHDVIVRELAA